MAYPLNLKSNSLQQLNLFQTNSVKEGCTITPPRDFLFLTVNLFLLICCCGRCFYKEFHVQNCRVIVVAFTLANTPTWLASPAIKAGTSVMVSTPSSAGSTTFTVSFASAFPTTTTLRIISGIIDFELAPPAGLTFGFSGFASAPTPASFTYGLVLYDGITLNSMKISYFCYDYTIHPYLTSATTSTTFAGTHQIFTGSGPRETAIPASFSTPIDLTHQVQICPFLHRFRLVRVSTADDFVVRVRVDIVNATNYRTVFSTDSNCQVKEAGYYRFVFDPTALQASTNLDVTFLSGINGVAQPFSLVFSDPTNFVAGLNHLSFSGSGPVPKLSLNTATFTLTSPGYQIINITTLNYRGVIACAPQTPYFAESQNLCYDVCPDTFYSDVTNKVCIVCAAGCGTCTNTTECASCQLRQYRVATPTNTLCPCLAGFYEDAAKQCVLCPADRACATCAIVSGSTNPGGIDCLSCSCAHHRTLSANGNCNCNTGYTTDVSVTNGPYCVKV